MKLLNQQTGFTIIETLVAITILMISIVGPLTIAHKGLLAAVYARDQVTASYLAQDAVEYLKNVRDANSIKNAYWLSGLNTCVESNPCKVDTLVGDPNQASTNQLNAGIEPCNGTTCAIYLKKASCQTTACGYTTSSTGTTKTQFYRYFFVTPRSGNINNEVQLSVGVTWNTGPVDNQVVYENEFFNILR